MDLHESASITSQVESEFGEGSGGDESIAEEVRESGEPSDSSGDREDEEGGVCGVTSVLNLTHHRVSPDANPVSLFLPLTFSFSFLPCFSE